MGLDNIVYETRAVNDKDLADKVRGEGLWDNIRKKRARGEPMRKKGEKGAPTADAIKRSQ